jgi:hypothetical protein
MIGKTFDTAFIQDKIDNSGIECLDDFNLESWLGTDYNLALVSSTGDVALFEFIPESNGTFIGHYLFETRGKEALVSAQQFLRMMFMLYGADMIVGMVPVEKKNVCLFTKWLGFTDDGVVDTLNGKAKLFTLERKDYK